ncbi:MAG TPA: hypothetical protein VK866_13545 [Acidimicrobiales bacterium]|nr:hypothetical protein [Acidimicrobiales bacterium]
MVAQRTDSPDELSPPPFRPVLVDATPPRRLLPLRPIGVALLLGAMAVGSWLAIDELRGAEMFVAVRREPAPTTAPVEPPSMPTAAGAGVSLSFGGAATGWSLAPADPPAGVVTAEPLRFVYLENDLGMAAIGVEQGGEALFSGEPLVVDGVQLDVVELPDRGPLIITAVDGELRVTWRSVGIPVDDAVTIASSLLPRLVADPTAAVVEPAAFVGLTLVAELAQPAVRTLPAAWTVATPEGRQLDLTVADAHEHAAAEIELRLRGTEAFPQPGRTVWVSGGFDPASVADDRVSWFHPTGHLVSLTGVTADDPVIGDLAGLLFVEPA